MFPKWREHNPMYTCRADLDAFVLNPYVGEGRYFRSPPFGILAILSGNSTLPRLLAKMPGLEGTDFHISMRQC